MVALHSKRKGKSFGTENSISAQIIISEVSKRDHIRMNSVIEDFQNLIERETDKILDFFHNRKIFSDELISGVYVLDAKSTQWGDRSKLKGKYGVYIFRTKSEIDVSREQFREYNDVSGCQIHKFTCHYVSGECFYVGSCYQVSLYRRYNQHYSNTDSGLSALKLSMDCRKWLKDSLEMLVFVLSPQYKGQYRRLLITSLESCLHERLEPIAGSSRV